MPGVRFGVIDSSGGWRAWCHGEKSEMLDNGVFVVLDLLFLKPDMNDDFNALVEKHWRIVESCSAALGLEWKHGN